MQLDYQALRTFADSWGLLFMFLIFVIAVVVAFRPSAKSLHADAAAIPLRED